jgi:hypothetical protein
VVVRVHWIPQLIKMIAMDGMIYSYIENEYMAISISHAVSTIKFVEYGCCKGIQEQPNIIFDRVTRKKHCF